MGWQNADEYEFIDEVEEYLIAQAAIRNPSLSNRIRLPKQSWNIKGVNAGGKGRKISSVFFVYLQTRF